MVLYIIIAVLILLFMVAIHEFGHYIVGKLLGFKINEFAVGFGPKLLSTKLKNGEVVSLRAIPLGGFCAFEGEENGADGQINPKSFYNEKPYKRILVLLAGGVFNLLSAVIFSFIFILVVGYAQPVVSSVTENSNGEAYSLLQTSDIIVAVDGEDITIMDSFSTLIEDKELGESITLTVSRSGLLIDIEVMKQEIVGDDGETYEGIGITTYSEYQNVSVLYALKYCVPFSWKMVVSVFDALGMIISGTVSVDQMTGPVGTIAVMAELGQMNYYNFLLLLPLLAANLGIFNLLPIPSLDGSKVIFTTIEWIRGKPINRDIENYIHIVGLALLFAFVIFLDVFSFL